MNEKFPYQIRPLEARDIPAVMSIDRIVFRDPWPESAYVQELYFNPHARYFILHLAPYMHFAYRRKRHLRRAAQVLGFVGMRVEREKAHISTLAIRPEWRGRGLGELLLMTAIEQALKDRAKSITLEVRISNYVAQDLYTKYGFRAVSRLYHYYEDGEDAYLMRATPIISEYTQELQRRHRALINRLQEQTVEFIQQGPEEVM